MKQFPGHPRAMQRVKRPSIPTWLLFHAALLETAPNSSRIDKSNHKIQGLLWYIFPFFLFYLTSRDHQEQLHLTGKFTGVSCLGWTQRLALRARSSNPEVNNTRVFNGNALYAGLYSKCLDYLHIHTARLDARIHLWL